MVGSRVVGVGSCIVVSMVLVVVTVVSRIVVVVGGDVVVVSLFIVLTQSTGIKTKRFYKKYMKVRLMFKESNYFFMYKTA